MLYLRPLIGCYVCWIFDTNARARWRYVFVSHVSALARCPWRCRMDLQVPFSFCNTRMCTQDTLQVPCVCVLLSGAIHRACVVRALLQMRHFLLGKCLTVAFSCASRHNRELSACHVIPEEFHACHQCKQIFISGAKLCFTRVKHLGCLNDKVGC